MKKLNKIHLTLDIIQNKPLHLPRIIDKNGVIMEDVKRHLPLQCPSCSSPMKVGRMFCEECGTEVCGSFELPLFVRLTEKEQRFAIDFIKASGSLKDMAKSMGVSYPTVRNRLDDLIDKLNKME